MASTPLPNKVVFRARALDPQKPLPIRIRHKCRQRSPKVKRAVAIPPSGYTGMEREEEQESHLQQAIIAQKQTSAGVTVENHVIPTPRVQAIGQDAYDRIYPVSNGKNKKLISFRDFVSFFLNQSVYDADSEDDDWLSTRPFIPIDEFEQIIEKLEVACQSSDMIIQPMEAKLLLQKFDPSIVDDVYDYWLQKKKQAASGDRSRKCSVLIPCVNTDGRRDEKTIVNPYIAFRKRLDKVQTRRKQKSEVHQYERLLRLNYAMKKSIALVEAMLVRDKLKLALTNHEEAIFQQQYLLSDLNNAELDKAMAASLANKPTASSSSTSTKTALLPSEPAQKRRVASLENGLLNRTKLELLPHKRRNWSKGNRVGMERLIDVTVNEAWLKRNAEIWSEITPAVTQPIALNTEFYSVERDKIAKFNVNSSVDGRFVFARKQGCEYHAPTALRLDQRKQTGGALDDDDALVGVEGRQQVGVDHGAGYIRLMQSRFSNAESESCDEAGGNADRAWNPSTDTTTTTIGFIRRRLGRGGRVIVDLKIP